MFELHELAAAAFPDLTPAERRLLAAVESGTMADCDDGAMPAAAGRRGAGPAERSVRAHLIRWLCVDRRVAERIDVKGIILAAARIVGRLDFSYSRLNFPLMLLRSAIPDGIDLSYAETRLIGLDGSFCAGIAARGVSVSGSISLSGDFRALGGADFTGATISGDLQCSGGRFLAHGGVALNFERAKIAGGAYLNQGFRAIGAVVARAAALGGDLDCSAGAFLNRGQAALVFDNIKVGGDALLGLGFRTNGLVMLEGARLGADLNFQGASFGGSERVGVSFGRAVVAGRLVWTEISGAAEVRLDAGHAVVGQLSDEAASWPRPEHMHCEGFIYHSLGPQAADVKARLAFLERFRPYSPHPYIQLAETLRRQGNDEIATRVLIAKEDARCRHDDLSMLDRLIRWSFGALTGYGYKTYRIMYVPLFFVIAGWILFAGGYRAGVMMPSRQKAFVEFNAARNLPEGYPAFNALIYSLDTFLPLTDFHQEDYWHPLAAYQCQLGRRQYRCGQWMSRFLGLQILAGWVFACLGLAGLLAKKSD